MSLQHPSLALLLPCFCLELWLPLGLATSYEDRCDGIEASMQKALQLHRTGQIDAAFGAVDEARAHFRSAVKLEPQEPAAYVGLAQAMLQTQHLDEAVPLWEAALARPLESPVKAWVQGRLRWTRYGRVSRQRDKVYQGGQGDLRESLGLIQQQIDIYPEDPNLHWAKATTSVMVSQSHTSQDETVRSYADAQRLTYLAWRAGLHARGRAQQEQATCGADGEHHGDSGSGLIYDWEANFQMKARPSALVNISYPDTEAIVIGARYGPHGSYKDTAGYVATFHDVGLSGDDGLIVDEARCQIYVPSAGLSMDLANNLQLLQIWGDPPTPQAGRASFGWFAGAPGSFRSQLPNAGQIQQAQVIDAAASVLQFAARSHFHVVTEVVGRLYLLKRSGILENEAVHLLAAGKPQQQNFFSSVLAVLLPELSSDRVVWWRSDGLPDVRLQIRRFYYPNWKPPTELGEEGGHCATPQSVLHASRAALLQVWSKAASEADLIIMAKRRDTSMRGSLEQEQQLRQGVIAIASEMPVKVSVKDFDGKLSAKKTLQRFARARAVIGLHGGALANILFAPAGSHLFEIGFASPFAGHYRHLAAAVGIEVSLLPLAEDSRGMGAWDVRLDDVQGALATIRAKLLPAESDAKAFHVGDRDDL